MNKRNKDKQYHYVYKTILAGSDKYYIGRHSTDNEDFLNEDYFGSGRWVKSIKDKSRLSKIILETYDTYEELCIGEEKYILEHIHDKPNCMNVLMSSGGFPPGELHPMYGKTGELHHSFGENNYMYGKTGELSPNYGRKHTIEQCKKHSELMSGENSPHAKLKEAQVIEIRRLYKNGNITQKQLALQYEVSHTVVSKIIRGTTWKRVDITNVTIKISKKRLTINQVLEIIELYKIGNITKSALGRKFNVSDVTVCNIIARKTWTHI